MIAMNVLPSWIDADEQQPPDEWPRPAVVAEIYGWGWTALRYKNGQWWGPGQFRDEVVNSRKVKYWMEVYPLPDGTSPQKGEGG